MLRLFVNNLTLIVQGKILKASVERFKI